MSCTDFKLRVRQVFHDHFVESPICNGRRLSLVSPTYNKSVRSHTEPRTSLFFYVKSAISSPISIVSTLNVQPSSSNMTRFSRSTLMIFTVSTGNMCVQRLKIARNRGRYRQICSGCGVLDPQNPTHRLADLFMLETLPNNISASIAEVRVRWPGTEFQFVFFFLFFTTVWSLF